MKIFIDFDDVLFNTKQFSAYCKDFFATAGIEQALFQKYYYDPADELKDGVKLFNPYGLLERLEKYEKKDVSKLREEFEAHFQDLHSFVFADTEAFLKTMGKNNLYLVSFGLLEWQRLKIINSGVDQLVENFVITKKLKARAIAGLMEKIQIDSEEKIIFIDDRVEQIEDVKKIFPQAITFLLCRKEGRYCDLKDEFCDYEAHSLKEIEKIIKTEHPDT